MRGLRTVKGPSAWYRLEWDAEVPITIQLPRGDYSKQESPYQTYLHVNQPTTLNSLPV